MTNAERDAIREYIQRTIDGAVAKAVSEAVVVISAEVVKQLEVVLREEMQRVERNTPPGKDGRDGKDAEFDKDALVREVVSLIPTPKDGKRGEKGADGRDGRDGKDGIASLDDLRAEVAKAVDASVGPMVQKQVAETVNALPTLQYQGVFREDRTYKPGHCVTWAGAMWHANAETKEKPGEGQTAWTLMVKRGDKGRDLR